MEPCVLPMPRPGPHELLSRIDAVGLCFSDVKVLRQGNKHPRITGRDLQKHPVIPGHETAITIVEVGDDLRDRFKIGERYLVQADVYYKGVNIAYGYQLPGGMAQYGIIGTEILEGDEGCYLIPIAADMGYAEGALVEPWACVEAAYRINYRTHPIAEGRCLAIGCTDPESLIADMRAPSHVRIAEPEDLDSIDGEFDDILVGADGGAEAIAKTAKLLARSGAITIVTNADLTEPVPIDIGRFHYDNLQILAAPPDDPWAGYGGERRKDLKPGGRALFIGAGGPMGRMHVSRALLDPNGPAEIVATDVDDARLAALADLLKHDAEGSGKSIAWRNPKTQPVEGTFDDIVIMAPFAPLVDEGLRLAREGAVVNVFAGVAKGTIAPLDLAPIAKKGARIVGSTGSRLEDMVYALRRAERGEISPNGSVAAIGSLSAAWDGMNAVAAGAFPGKIVLYPQIAELPLTALPALKDRLPNVAAKLGPGGVWTVDAERELIGELGKS